MCLAGRTKKALYVVGVMSAALLVGCQSTKTSTVEVPPYQGGMTQTEESNLIKYSSSVRVNGYLPTGIADHNTWREMDKSINYTDEIAFNLPLNEIVDCGTSNGILSDKWGTLSITNVQSVPNFVSDVMLKGYVESDQFDVSQCQATLEFLVDAKSNRSLLSKMINPPKQVKSLSPSYNSTIAPSIKMIVQQSLLADYDEAVKGKEMKRLSTQHIKELRETGTGIAQLEVCMEKGTFFLKNDNDAKQVLKNMNNHARNKIKNKVTNKPYYDKDIFKTAYQQGLKHSRYEWHNNYLLFVDRCSSWRNVVDSVVN